MLLLALSGFPGDEHVPQPVRVAVELAAGAAVGAGFWFSSGCRAVLGPVLVAGAAEASTFVHIARQLASSASARAFRRRAVGGGESEAGGADGVDDVDVPLDPAVAAPVRAAARRAKGGALGAAGAHAGVGIDIPPEPATGASGWALAGRGKVGLDRVAGGAHLVFQVDIPVDPAPRAVRGLATNRAKRRLLAASALLTFHIHIPRHAAPAAPERALGARGGKGGHFFAAGGAHFADQVDISLDPAPRAVRGLATNRAKRRPLAAPALFARHIHIPRHAARAAPERLLGTSTCEGGAFFAAHGALARHFFTVKKTRFLNIYIYIYYIYCWGKFCHHFIGKTFQNYLHNKYFFKPLTNSSPDRFFKD
jgi:hypothetical protein